MAAYQAALDAEWQAPQIGASRTKPGTVNAALVNYYNFNAEFKAFQPSTQKMRRAILERFRNEHGDRPMATMDEKAVRAILAKRSPLAARNLLKTLRHLIRHTIEIEMRKDDPTAAIKIKAPKSDGHHSWTDAEIAKYEARHPIGTRARLALALLLYTGQRRGDVVRMGRQHVVNNILSLKQEKTGNPIDIPVRQEIWEAANAMPKSHQLAFLVTDAGNAFTAAGFGNWFRECCNEADLSHCSAHGLRKAAATRMAENGATTEQLKSWFGWTSDSEPSRYTKAANRARMAAEIADKLNPRTEIGKPAIQFAKTKAKALKSKQVKS
ncbi:MAG: tyrosine-type recombinase/integrase [Xanthobacteraceae bacterium]|nr:tyrosine-type recombinase/integrase [Xanthobacteraceae bacterium]